MGAGRMITIYLVYRLDLCLRCTEISCPRLCSKAILLTPIWLTAPNRRQPLLSVFEPRLPGVIHDQLDTFHTIHFAG